MSNITSSIMAARNAIIAQNNALQEVTKNDPAGAPNQTGKANGPDFAGTMKTALAQVNSLQQASSEAQTAYTVGETTDIASVMMAKQKASIGFEATLQVRNKLLSAYKDIMNMPV
jgi:flagellar hook-basal body complex protein FliE